MYEIPEAKLIQDNDYKIRCIINVNGKDKVMSFSRNDYDILFISFGEGQSDDYIRAICIPSFYIEEKPDIVEGIKRVHPSIPIFYIEELSLSSFAYGFLIGVKDVDKC